MHNYHTLLKFFHNRSLCRHLKNRIQQSEFPFFLFIASSYLINNLIYSMFWICSLTFSISVFKFNSDIGNSKSFAFDKIVFASRFISCAIKSKLRPIPLPHQTEASLPSYVRHDSSAYDLFICTDLICKNHNLCCNTSLIDLRIFKKFFNFGF